MGTDGRHRRVTRWLVDGMNVIGSRPDRWWNDPDKAVRRLIDELDRYSKETGEEVTVVFDRKPRDVSPGVHGAITVAFASRRGRNAADHEIAEMVADDKSPATLKVVTSDRDLADRVRQRGARVASSGGSVAGWMRLSRAGQRSHSGGEADLVWPTPMPEDSVVWDTRSAWMCGPRPSFSSTTPRGLISRPA